jgi:hypothetical protein
MNCDEFRSAVLGGGENVATSRHEQSCPACHAQVADLRAAHESLSDSALWEEPPPELAIQVEDLIRNAARGPRHKRVAPRQSWTWVGVAAAIVAAVAAVVITTARDAGPDWDVALPATDLAPNAIASVQGWNEPAGTRMILAVAGLDPAPDGFIYEFWLSDGPIHISAGTFHSPGEIELWSGVTRADFPRLWITLEPIDEDESPSGQTVLDTGRA